MRKTSILIVTTGILLLLALTTVLFLGNTKVENQKVIPTYINNSKNGVFDFPVDFTVTKNITQTGEPYIKECFNRYNERIANKKITEAIEGLSNYMIMEPLAAINETCKPPPLAEVKCENYKTAFGNNPVPDNKKVGILIQFGFDIDLLEVYLNEVYDLVDKFFITESVVIHSPQQDLKPLMWDRVKFQKRFYRFSDKIVHFIIDGSELKTEGGKWVSENNQEKLRWEKFLKWNEENKFFEDKDVIGFGDADEIPSRKAINILKHCSGDYTSIDIGSLFVYGTYDTIVKSDWPIPNHPFSFGDPSFFTLKAAKSSSRGEYYPTRRRGRSGKYLLGNMGIHLSYYQYLPFILNKSVVCSECKPLKVKTNKSMDEITKQIIQYRKSGHNWFRLDKVKDEIRDTYFIPWFLKCNPERFPTFYHNPDPRLYLSKEEINFEC
ncbi:glycosyltransferase family 17 protein [Piromyces sp. E2]|nr:glycosyltransferase family 17 protein [Piromyces sp. E2]|eukprot:OUM60414.1 glycosyltransferase family 17 protein [Piromyces sp. E2]